MTLHAPPAADVAALENSIVIHGAYEVRPNDSTARPRHPWLDTFARYLHTMSVAQAAAQAAAQLNHRRSSSVVVLPTWVWVSPLVRVGARKSQFMFPARLVWDAPQVLVADDTTEVSWTCEGLGHTLRGTLKVDPVTTSTSPGGGSHDDAVPMPLSVAAVKKSATTVRNTLEDMQTIGSGARWLALEMVKPYVLDAVDLSRYTVAREIAGDTDEPLTPAFDEIVRDRIVTEMLYGYDGDFEGDTSPVWRMLDRCLEPRTLTKVDMMRYLNVTIKRDADDATRRRLGDPRVGPRVRRVARQMGTQDPDSVMARFHELYPADRIGRQRTQQALSVGSDVSSLTVTPIHERRHT